MTALCECAIRLALDFERIPGDSPLAVAPSMYALFIVAPPALWWQLRGKRRRELAPAAA